MFEIILKLFLVIGIGWIFRKFRVLPESAEEIFNKYLYYIGLPAVTLVQIARTSFENVGHKFLVLNTLPILAVMAGVYLLWKAGFIESGFARLLTIVPVLGNTVYLGFAVVGMRFGEDMIGYAAVMISIHNLVIFIAGFFFVNLICGGACPFLAPGIYLASALMLGYQGMISKTAFLEYCMPAAVLNFVIAKEFGFDSCLVSQVIVFTTLALIPLAFLFDWTMIRFL